MANQLEIPYINPLHFVPVNAPNPARFATKYYDDYLFEDTILGFEEKTKFFIPWHIDDTIKLQMTSNFAPLQMQLQDTQGNIIDSTNMTQVRANRYNPGFYLYEYTFALSAAPDLGCYRYILIPGGSVPDSFKSEWFRLTDDPSDTMLLTAFNSRYHADVVFETGIVFELRVPGYIIHSAPASQDVMYKDQILNPTQLSSKAYRNAQLFAGDGGGVPMWVIDKINQFMTCDNFAADGFLWAKGDSPKWTEYTNDDYTMKGYSMPITPGLNRSSKIYNPSIDTSKKLIIGYNLASNVFGSVDSQGGNITTPITDVE